MRSAPRPARPSATWPRSHASSETSPSRSVCATSCSASPMWRRSVSRRSPPTSASTRAGRPPTDAASTTAGDAAALDDLDPVAQRLGDLVGEPVAALGEVAGGVADEAGERRGPHARAAVRLLEGLEQREPLDRRGGGEDAAAARDDRRHPHLEQRLLRRGEVGVAVADDGDVLGLERLAVERRTRVEQPADVEGEVARDVRAHVVDGQRGPRALAEGVAPHGPQPQRRAHRGADQPAVAVVGLDRTDHDALGPELGAGEQLLEGRQQAGVAAPVDRQGLAGRGGGGCLEVRGDVAAAEGVDGLLGVADEHHRGDPAEGAVEDLPLHGVGVLELVDEHDRPALAHPHPGGRVLVLERVGELAQQVVVRQDPEPALARLELGAHGLGEADAAADGGGAVLGVGLEVGLRVVHRGPRDGERVGVAEARRTLGERERAQVEVVDHLAHQVVEVLDQPGAGVGVAGDAERGEHHRAELVGGRDRGGVEAGEGLDDAAVACRELGLVTVDEEGEQLGAVRAHAGVAAEEPLGLDELGAHPLPQLLARGAAEGDDEHLVEPGHPLGDVAGHEGADGPGLAGAGAGLEQRGADARERGRDVEGGEVGRRLRCGAHSGPSFSLRSRGSQTCQAYVVSPASRSTSSGASSPYARRW